jgi:hypothetical protein
LQPLFVVIAAIARLTHIAHTHWLTQGLSVHENEVAVIRGTAIVLACYALAQVRAGGEEQGERK